MDYVLIEATHIRSALTFSFCVMSRLLKALYQFTVIDRWFSATTVIFIKQMSGPSLPTASCSEGQQMYGFFYNERKWSGVLDHNSRDK